MRVLVTGANGFVGRALLPAFIPFGHQARVAVRSSPTPPFAPNIEVRPLGDLSQEIDWAPLLEGCEAVVHLAGIAHIGAGIPEDTYDRVNHRATAALARAAKVAGIKRFVFMSSIRAQSGPTADHVLTEDDPPKPVDAYGRSKLAAENAIKEAGVPYTILRPVLIYGPNAKGNFADLMKYAAMSFPLPLGGLTKQRSLVSLSGLVQAVIFALASPNAINQTFIVSDSAPVSLAAMITALRQGFGREEKLFSVPRPLLRAALMVLGKGDALDRIDGQLIASSAKLVAAGWQAMPDSAASLKSLAQRMKAAR